MARARRQGAFQRTVGRFSREGPSNRYAAGHRNGRAGSYRRMAASAKRRAAQSQEPAARSPASFRTPDSTAPEASPPGSGGASVTKYLLDTNVVSELRKPKPHGAVVAWIEGL